MHARTKIVFCAKMLLAQCKYNPHLFYQSPKTMFRSFFVYLSKATWARKMVTHWGVMRRVATRFVAGESLEDAIRVIRMLNKKGISATLDLLGENTTTQEESRQAAQDIVSVLDAIDQEGLCANVSVKLTQLGLGLDLKRCAENLRDILDHARRLGNFIRIDMEDSTVTQSTLDLLYQMLNEGYQNVGIVIQSYLYRSDKDIAQLVERGIPVRLCKGAYKEPAAVAYPKKSDVDSAYDRLTTMLLDGAVKNDTPRISSVGKIPPLPALATHDVRRIRFAKEYAGRINIPMNAVEFQMLYGIRRDLQEQLAGEGYPVRVYVPYGTQWYPYYMRRLGERPANVWFIISNLFIK
jgi:proline dehydrogenase